MKKVSKMGLCLAGWLATIAAVAVVLGAVALMAAPRLLGWQSVIVLTGSMEPALKVGGLAFVEPTHDAGSVQVGDIITFRSLKDPSRQVSHRVIEIIGDADGLQFRTKGDNSELADQQLVPSDNLVGKVRFHLPYLGYAADKLRHRENYYLFVGIAAGLLIVSEIFNIGRSLRRGRKKAPERSPEPVGDVLSTVRWHTPRRHHPVKRAATGQRLILLVLMLLVVMIGALVIGGGLWNVAGPVRRGRRSRPQARRQEGRG